MNLRDEVDVYEKLKEEIGNDEWFQKDTKIEDLDKVSPNVGPGLSKGV